MLTHKCFAVIFGGMQIHFGDVSKVKNLRASTFTISCSQPNPLVLWAEEELGRSSEGNIREKAIGHNSLY